MPTIRFLATLTFYLLTTVLRVQAGVIDIGK